jgi:subtilisin family serine protease
MASQLLIQGSALVGHADEFLARRQLWNAGCVLDDDMFGYLAGGGSRVALVTGTADTLTAAENGTTLFYNNAAAVAVTLPAIQPGLEYEIVRTADEELVVSSGEGDNIIMGNDLSADSVTFTTAGEQIGARVKVRSVYVGTTLKWLIEIVTVPFSTDNYLAMSLAS